MATRCWHHPYGLRNREIAAAMYIGTRRPRHTFSRLLTKVGVRDRVQAVVLAYETGLVRLGAPTQQRDSTKPDGLGEASPE